MTLAYRNCVMNSRILTAVITFSAVVSLLFTSLAQSRLGNRRLLQTPARTNLDEANQRAKRFFDQRFTKCGDSVFTNVWTDELQAYRLLKFKTGAMTFDPTLPV